MFQTIFSAMFIIVEAAGLIVIPVIGKALVTPSIHDPSEDINGIYNQFKHDKNKATDSIPHIQQKLHKEFEPISELDMMGAITFESHHLVETGHHR
jgi:hypothetical protein